MRQALAEARHVLGRAPRIGRREQVELFRQGRTDAKSGVAYVDEENRLRAPYLEVLAQNTNAQIVSSWNECNGRMFKIRRTLEKGRASRSINLRRLEELFGQREEELSIVRSLRRDGDETASDYLVEKRVRHREALARESYDREEETIRAEIRRIELSVIGALEDYRDASDIGMMHEEMIRREYLRRLAIYIHGASRYIKVDAAMVNDSALSDEARKSHIEEFGDYDFSLE